MATQRTGRMLTGGKITRRRLVGGTMALVGGLGGPAIRPAEAIPTAPPVLSLAMAHTGERFDGAYRSPTGQLLAPAKTAIDNLLRDWRTGGAVAIDPVL